MKELSKIAELHANIWWNDDKRNPDILFKNATRLLELTGCNKKMSREISVNIKDAYKLYGEADDNKYKLNSKELDNYFDRIFEYHKEAWKDLDGKNYKTLALLHSLWWRAFYKKTLIGDFQAMLLILIQHIIKFRKFNLSPAFMCSYYMIKAGYEHNKGDKESAEKFLENYWEITYASNIKTKFMY